MRRAGCERRSVVTAPTDPTNSAGYVSPVEVGHGQMASTFLTVRFLLRVRAEVPELVAPLHLTRAGNERADTQEALTLSNHCS